MPNKNKFQELIAATQQHINLSEAVIEKDYYVTQVIHAISGIKNEYFRLVFCGGTCLAKAHKIANRMSEDVDFKIEPQKTVLSLSKTQRLKALKKFRSQITSNLSLPGLIAGEPVVRNEGRYSRIELNYSSFFPSGAGLRPHILLELTLSNIRLAVDSLPIRTIIEDHLKNVNLFVSSSTLCVSINETAIEKWVALTRRIVAIDRAYHSDDKTLIRHIYDLNAIKSADKIHADFFTLAKTVVNDDSRQFKNQHPEYASNPEAEIRQSLSLLKNKSIWKERYQEFIDTMIYDKATALEYENVLAGIEHLSEIAIKSLNTAGG